MIDFIMETVFPVFFGLIFLGLVALGLAGVVEWVQYVRAAPAERACHVRMLDDERLPFSTNVVCVPRYKGSDSLNVRVGQP